MHRLIAWGSWTWMVPTLLLCSVSLATARDLPAELRSHEVGEFTLPNGDALPRAASRPLTLHLEDGSRSLVLDLVPKGMPPRKARYIGADDVRVERLESKLFVGQVRGDQASYARVVLVGDSVAAVIRLGSGEEIWAEPMRHFDDQASPRTLLTYRRSDIDNELAPDIGECGYVAPGPTTPALRVQATQGGTSAPVEQPPGRFLADGEVKGLKIAVVGEFEYTEEFATEQDALDDLNAVMELVADIYTPELGVAVYPDVEVVTDPSDPYFPIVSTTTSGQILTMVGAYRVAENHLANGYGATHLVMNSVSAAGNLGVTNTQVCNSGGGTWWKARLTKTMYYRVITAAHELAHNCGAGHDNDTSHCPGTLFEAGGAGTDQHIMQSAGDYADSWTFSVCSKYAARNRIYSTTQPTSCLTPVTCGDANGNGQVQSNDALLALTLATCSTCAFNGLADVQPQPTPNLLIQTNDANAILQMAVGSLAIPSECGQPHCVCGDGTQACHEECDDGNLANGDGCTQYCQTE